MPAAAAASPDRAATEAPELLQGEEAWSDDASQGPLLCDVSQRRADVLVGVCSDR